MASKRKLTLNRETVRLLSSREMDGIAGGARALSDACPKTQYCGTLICDTSNCPKKSDYCTFSFPCGAAFAAV